MFKLIVIVLSVQMYIDKMHDAEFLTVEYPIKFETRNDCRQMGQQAIQLVDEAFDYECIEVKK